MTTVMLAGGGTGGHLMPALAVAAATGEAHAGWHFVVVGAERGIEAQVLPQRGLRHHLLPLEPIYRRQWWRNVRWPFLLPQLVRRIDALLDAEKPAVVVGTGGYVSGPVLWRAARRGIPTGILELDVQPGLATRMLAKRVREIWLAVPETQRALPASVQERAIVTGAPIVPPDPTRRAAAMTRLGFSDDRPVLVITGGSQGSLAINRIVAAWLRGGGAGQAQVLWSTGRATHAEFAFLHNPPHIHVLPFIDPMADAWSVADACVARSGMMTLAELCAWGIPSVLIPLPTAAADHQMLNARAMSSSGAALVLNQQGLDAAQFGVVVAGLLGDDAQRSSMAAAARARARPNAAREIAARITQMAGGAG